MRQSTNKLVKLFSIINRAAVAMGRPVQIIKTIELLTAAKVLTGRAGE